MSADEKISERESVPPSRMRSRLRIAAASFVAFLLLLRVALPFAIEWSVPRIAASQNFHAEIGNVDLGLIAGEITLEDLVVDFLPADEKSESPAPPDHDASSQPLFTLDRLFIAFEWTDLISRRLHLTDLDLFHPVLSVVELEDGSLDLPIGPTPPTPPTEAESDAQAESDTAEPSPPAEIASDDSEAAASPDAAWEFVLDRFELNDPDLSLRQTATRETVVRVAADQLGFDALFVGADGIELGGLDLEHPELFVQREWLLGLGQRPTASSEVASDAEEPEPAPSDLPSLRMKHLKIQRADFTVRTQEGPIKVGLQFEVTDVGTSPGQTFPIDLGLEIDEAQVGLGGQIGLNPLSFVGRFDWTDLSVPPFLLLAYPQLVPWLASCNAFGDVQIAFRSVSSEDEPAGLSFDGSAGVSSLRFKHPTTGELALEWDALELDVDEVFVPLEPTAENPIRVALSRLALTSPTIVYTNPPDALNELLAALGDESAEGQDAIASNVDETPEEPGVAPRISISQLELTDGTLRYVDRSVQPTHETKIHKLHTSVDHLMVDAAAGADQLSIEGLIQSAGSFTLRGMLPDGQGELDFALRELDLVSYDSLARGAGWEIESGTTSLDSHIVAGPDGYRTKNALVFHQLDVAPENDDGFASQFGLSIDLVLALLRDPSGDIPLSVPVTIGNDGGAGLDFGAILLSALRNALQGAIASPIKMLGMLIPDGASTDTLGALPFAPGEDSPRNEAQSQLDSIAEFLEDRPMLSLSLRSHWSEEDRIPTARKILEEKAISGDDFPDVSDSSFFARRRVAAALRVRAEGEEQALTPEDEALLERYVAAQEVSEDRLGALAQARAESVRSALVEIGADAEALSIGVSSSAEQPSVSVELGARRKSDTTP